MEMAKQESKRKRFEDQVRVCREHLDILESADEDFKSAISDLADIQSEYQDWQDNLPENLQDSPTAELLTEVCDLDLDLEIDMGEYVNAVETAENLTLPVGFGRD